MAADGLNLAICGSSFQQLSKLKCMLLSAMYDVWFINVSTTNRIEHIYTVVIVIIISSFEGAFLIPYMIWMVLLAIPLVFLEVSYPQFVNLGAAKLWNLCPLFKGNKKYEFYNKIL